MADGEKRPALNEEQIKAIRAALPSGVVLHEHYIMTIKPGPRQGPMTFVSKEFEEFTVSARRESDGRLAELRMDVALFAETTPEILATLVADAFEVDFED